jgi:hypothetical protein
LVNNDVQGPGIDLSGDVSAVYRQLAM